MYDDITNRKIFSAVQEYIRFHVTKQVLGPELTSRRAEYNIAYSGGCLYIFLIYYFYHLTCLCNNFYGLSAVVGFWSSAFILKEEDL